MIFSFLSANIYARDANIFTCAANICARTVNFSACTANIFQKSYKILFQCPFISDNLEVITTGNYYNLCNYSVYRYLNHEIRSNEFNVKRLRLVE